MLQSHHPTPRTKLCVTVRAYFVVARPARRVDPVSGQASRFEQSDDDHERRLRRRTVSAGVVVCGYERVRRVGVGPTRTFPRAAK